MTAIRHGLPGQRYGRLVVASEGPRYSNKNRSRRVYCNCDCGTSGHLAGVGNLSDGKVLSCGCLQREATSTHGMSGSRVHVTWNAMLARCDNPAKPEYKHYGGRGITVCDRWRKFENFLADMGDRPIGTSIDRIDVNGNYEPGNCRWATRAVQRRNQRPRDLSIKFSIDTISEFRARVAGKGIGFTATARIGAEYGLSKWYAWRLATGRARIKEALR